MKTVMVKPNKEPEEKIDILEGQDCPFCNTKNLTLSEEEREIPYFGKAFLFGMTCTNCKYHKSDVEIVDKNEPAKYTLEIDSEDDMSIRIIKSAEAIVKIPHIMTWEPGAAAQGFITNVEGILRRAKYAIEQAKEDSDDRAEQKKCKNMLKKLQKVMWGQDKLKLIIEDKTGNSVIISEKAKKKKL